MALFASAFVDWGALGKILLAGLIFGSGVVILFGFLLLGLKYVNTSKGEGGRAVGYVLAIGCGFVCLAAVVLGIYAITQKPSSKKPTSKSKSALVAPARARRAQPAGPT
jgi:hypothetical protein